MTQKTHSPTPYKEDGSEICQNNNGHFHVIAQVKLWTDFNEADFRNKQDTTHGRRWLVDMACPIEGTEEANAAFICKAVNNHEALLSVARKAAKYLSLMPVDSCPHDLLGEMEVTIAKATGEI